MNFLSKNVKVMKFSPYIQVEINDRKVCFMGWAKYHEDDLSIYCGRMYMLENKTVAEAIYRPVVKEKAVAAAPIKVEKSKPRHGLELHLQASESKKIARKLQLHGWWWSKIHACWCNDDLQVNREFARTITRSTSATLRVNT